MTARFDAKMGAIVILVILLAASLGYAYNLNVKIAKIKAAQPKYKLLTDPETLTIAMDISIITTFDGARAYEGTSILIINQCFDKLVDFIPPDYTTVIPEVAESWEVLPDGVTWRFHIRKGITFTNGDPLDAEAVAYTLKRVIILKQEASWLLTQFVSDPENIKVIDDYTVEVKLDRPVAPSFFLSTLACTTTAIVNPKVVEAHAKEGDMGSDWMTTNGGTIGTGSGPFILEEYVPEDRVVLVANENYWRGPPKIKKIIIKHVPEPETQRLMLEAGEVDIAWDLYAEQLKEVAKEPGIRVYKTNSWGVTYIGMNTGVEPLGDNRVRKAIKYAIDYDGIINEILAGAAVKAQTVIPYGFLGFNPSTPYYKNVEKAKALLAEAGYPNGFSIEMAVPAGAYPALDIAAKIKSDLAEIGIDVKIVQITSSEMYERYRAQGLQMVLAGWGSDYPDPDCNAKAFGDYRIHQLAWRNKWYDDYVADLCERAEKEPDPSVRESLYLEITNYILENGPYAVLYQPLVQRAVRTWVEGFIVSPSSASQPLSGTSPVAARPRRRSL